MTQEIADDVHITGKVGIGIENPTEKLEVDGIVKATEFVGKGSEITDLNGENIKTGIIDDARIPSTVARETHFDPISGHKHTSGTDDGPKISHSNLVDVLEVDPKSTDANATKHVSDALAKGWQDHINISSGNPHGTSHSNLVDILEVDPKSTDANATKHVSDALAKGWQDHINVTSGNPHGTTAMFVGALPNVGGTINGSLHVNGEMDITGSVGIGTTNPTEKLEVAGNIRIIPDRCGPPTDISSCVTILVGTNDPKADALNFDIFQNPSISRNINVGNSWTFNARSKNFSIDHPLCPNTHKLVHSTLEGPEIAVFYRGEAQLSNGKAIVTLPDYFEALTRKENRTVLLTPKFEEDTEVSMLAVSEVKDGKFTVKKIDSNNPSQKFYWEVKAIRADVEKLEVERTKNPVKLSD